MASEAQQQQKLINSGALANIGQARGTDLTLTAVEEVFKLYMGKLVQELTRRVDEPVDGKEISASGNLSSSIRFEYSVAGTEYVGKIFMADYADYQDKGVRGVGPNNRNMTSPYKFKFATPSKAHVDAIEKWMREKNTIAIVTAPKGLHEKVKGGKGLKDIQPVPQTLAYIIARASKMHGLAARNFKQGAVNSVMPAFSAALAKAMAKDVKVNIDTVNAN